MLEARGLGRRGVLHDVCLTLREGEIVGMAGLVGAGRTEVARALFGDLATDAGEILVEVRRYATHRPGTRSAPGSGSCPRTARSRGSSRPSRSGENLALPSQGRLAPLGIVRAGAERRLAEEYVGVSRSGRRSIAQAVKP